MCGYKIFAKRFSIRNQVVAYFYDRTFLKFVIDDENINSLDKSTKQSVEPRMNLLRRLRKGVSRK